MNETINDFFEIEWKPQFIYLHVNRCAEMQMLQYQEALRCYSHSVEFAELPKEKREQISAERKRAKEWLKNNTL